MTIVEIRGAVGAVWFVFVVVWVIASRNTKRTVERPANQLGYRVAWIAAFAILFVSRPRAYNRFAPLTDHVLPGSDAVVLAGLALATAGLALAFWARATLGGNWSGTVTFKEDHSLIDTGPYAFVRHPIYTAILLMFVGTAVAYGTLGSLLAVPVAAVSFVVKARQEEHLLEKHFPDAYPAYRARTRMIVPFLL